MSQRPERGGRWGDLLLDELVAECILDIDSSTSTIGLELSSVRKELSSATIRVQSESDSLAQLRNSVHALEREAASQTSAWSSEQQQRESELSSACAALIPCTYPSPPLIAPSMDLLRLAAAVPFVAPYSFQSLTLNETSRL